MCFLMYLYFLLNSETELELSHLKNWLVLVNTCSGYDIWQKYSQHRKWKVVLQRYISIHSFLLRGGAWQKEMAQILYKFSFYRGKKVKYAQTFLNRACEDEFPKKNMDVYELGEKRKDKGQIRNHFSFYRGGTKVKFAQIFLEGACEAEKTHWTQEKRKEKGQIRNKLCVPQGNKSNQELWQAQSTLATHNKR